MINRQFWTIAIGFSLLPCLIWLQQTTAVADQSSLWSLLQRSEPGYVVLMRHAAAPGTGDPPGFKLDNCATQRNLSPEGRSQATKIGQAFRRRNIRVARVLSSQWCRCLDTARLLNLASVEPLPALNSFFQNPGANRQQTALIRQFILSQRHTPDLIILVTHQVNITALTRIFPESGEMIVLKVSNTSLDVVGRLQVS